MLQGDEVALDYARCGFPRSAMGYKPRQAHYHRGGRFNHLHPPRCAPCRDWAWGSVWHVGNGGRGVLFTSEGPCWAQETGCRGFGPQAHMVRVGTLWLACLKAAATSRVEGADCQCCDRTLRMDVEPVH